MNSKKVTCPFCHNISTLHFNYTEPPELETKFDIKNYFRQFYKCSKCFHYHAVHQIDLDKLYENSYLDHTYGSNRKISN